VKHSKLLLFLILAFGLGFTLHFLITNLQIKPEISLLPQQNVAGVQTSTDQFITYVNYDGKEFKPSAVTIKKGNYLAITNKSSDKQMWLVSDNADLNTQRGYGEGERLKLTLLKEGRYKVTNRLDTKGFLKIVVKP